MAADDTYSFGLVGIMDQLWFHQAILFTQPINPLLSSPNILDESPHQHHPDTFTDSTDIVSTVPEEAMLQYQNSLSSESSMVTDESDSKLKEENDRPTRVDSLGFRRARSRSQPSSRLSPDQPRRKIFTASKSLQECTSYNRSFEHLEMEEVKGLMDLGFIFRKEHLSPRMMSLVPGLNVLFKKQGQEEEQEQELSSEEEEEKMIERPYLSEAWLIRRPRSPLLNLQAPNKAEMKMHLKSWARSVAAVVEQEC